MAKMCISLIFALMVALVSVNPVEVSTYKLDQEIDFGTYDEYEPRMPDACDPSDSYCFVKGDNYPDDVIKELLEDMRSLIVENPENRISDGSGCDTECPATKIFEPIYYISDENYRVRVVVQSQEKFQQLYTVRRCTNKGPITSATSKLFMNHRALETFKPECVTTKMDVDFFVLSDERDPKTGKPKMEIARARGGIPVCCKCQLNFNS